MARQERDCGRSTGDGGNRFHGRKRSRETLVAVALVALVSILARADSALGDPADPQPGGAWPEGLVPYVNAAPEHDWALRQAVAAWNASGASLRFVRSDDPSAAVVIESTGDQPCGHGRATLGYSTQPRVTVFTPRDAELCDRFSAARVLAHELGHVLGLGHIENTCAAMNAVGSYRGSEKCKGTKPWRWRCRLLERADVLAAVELYGGAPAAVRRPASCALYRRIGAPQAPRLLRQQSTSNRLAMAFGRPADVGLPPFLEREGGAGFLLTYGRGRCARRPGKARYRWSVAPGEEQVVFRPVLGPGVHCLRVWAVDELGRVSSSASTLRVDVRG